MYTINKRTKLRRIRLILFLASILGIIFLYFNNVVLLFVSQKAEFEAKVMALDAINKAGSIIRSLESFFGDYYDYKVNNDGEVVLITSNSANINKMQVAARAETQRALAKLSNSELTIPLGAFTGSSLLSDWGPDINLKLSIIASSETVWNSYFYNEGINQTIHRLILRINTQLHILIPARAADVNIIADFIIAEDVILGRVPDSYINGLNSDNVFDLIP
ncbi:MAG: sporulation protein YunB [Christensenellaceae bacterium]|nr:sporulation protein YunB [Christensenellaceae bacterium]